MKKLIKHLKPYALMLIIIIGLLFVQAWADLKLPNYMSSIVNVGIQQSGIEHASPHILTQDGFDFVTSVLPNQQSDVFKEAYTLENGSLVYNNSVPRERLDVLMGDAVWTLLNFDLGGGTNQSPTIGDDVDLNALFAMTPMFQMMDNQLKLDAFTKAQAVENSLKVQTGVVLGKLLYEDAGFSIESLQRDYILKTGLKMMGITLIGILSAVGVGFTATRTGSGFSKSLRREIFEKVQTLSSAEYTQFSPSSLVVRTVNDVSQVQMMIMMSLRMFFYAPIMAIGGIVMIQRTSTNMTWIIAVACAVLMAVLLIVYLVSTPKFKVRQKLVDRVNQIFRENLNGLLVIRAFGNSDFERDRFGKANQDVADVTLFLNRVMAFMMPIMMLIMNMSVVGIIWFGSYQVNDGLLQIGDMMAFMSYAMQIIMSFLMISLMFIFIPRAMVSLNRIEEVLNTENSIEDPINPKSFDTNKMGWVEFENVSFKYSGADESVLSNISFVSKPGQTTAIIGSTGSGKTTIINLIPRFFDVNDGCVKVNGVDVREVRQHDLRDSIGYVPQKGYLHTGTVLETLKYGDNQASDDLIDKALSVAQGKFILEKPEGLEFELAQGGTNVSGGQRQRLSIARALVKESPILIFDDSFSALDFATDKKLREALDEYYGNATRIVVAQRVNTIVDADQILVLEEGKLVGKGTHRELLETCPTYYEIATSQLSEEELANAS